MKPISPEVSQLLKDLPLGVGDQVATLLDSAILELAAEPSKKAQIPQGSIVKSDNSSAVSKSFLSSLGAFSSDSVKISTKKRMMLDQDIQIGFHSLTAPIVGGGWAVECSDGDIATFDQQALEPVWTGLIQACMDAAAYGFQAFEKIWTIQDLEVRISEDESRTYQGRALYQELYDIDPESVEVVKEKGELKGLKVGKAFLPIDSSGKTVDKGAIITLPRVAWGNYYGCGRLEIAYPLWWSYQAIMRFMLRYLERLGDPPIVGWAPLGKRKDELGNKVDNIDLIIQCIQNIRSHASVGIPYEVDDHGNQMWGLKILEDNERSDLWLNVLQHLSMLKLRSFLQPEKTIAEGGSTGSFAMVKEQRDVGLQMTVGLQRVIFEQITAQILQPLNTANFGTNAPRARIIPGALDRASLEILENVMEHIFEWEKGNVPERPLAQMVDRLQLAEALRIPLDQDMDKDEGDIGDEVQDQSDEKPKDQGGNGEEQDQVRELGSIYLASTYRATVRKYLKLVQDRAAIWKARTADPVLEKELDRLTAAVEKALNQSTPSKQLAAIARIETRSTEYKKGLQQFLSDMHEIGRQAVSEELGLKAVPGLTAQDKSYLDVLSSSLANDRAAQFARIVNVAAMNAVKWGQTAREAIFEIRERVGRLLQDRSNKTTALSEAWRGYQDGRFSGARQADLEDPITHVQFINENPKAPICRDLAGQIMPVTDPRLFAYHPPLHHNCTTTLRYLTASQAEAMGEIPPFRRPSQASIDSADEFFVPKELMSSLGQSEALE